MNEALRDIIECSTRIVFFGGAGVSTASGIPDYRSKGGLYAQQYDRSPEEMLSHTFFLNDTQEFYDFYRDNLMHLDAQPNDAHVALVNLEKEGKISAVVTQNVDGLHQQAGSCKVIELHGSVWRNYCMDCHEPYPAELVAANHIVPHCHQCGGIVKPDVVLYEEPLDEQIFTAAIEEISSADTLIIGGTSLAVYPAAGMLQYYRGANLVLINQTPTVYDNRASLIIRDPIDKVLCDFG